MAKISADGATGGGQLPVPDNAFVREDGVITAPPVSGGGGGAFPTGLFTLTDAPTIEVDASAGSVLQATLNGDRTLGTPSNPLPGQPLLFEFIQGAGGNFTLGFSDAYAFPASIPQPALSTTEGQRDFLQFIYDALVELWLCTGWVPDQNAGIVAIPQGGTGQDTQQGAINALAGAQTSGYYLRGNGENAEMAAIESGDLPALTAAPQWTDAAGLELTAQGAQASPTSPVSVTSTNITSIAGMTVPANDPVAGAVYRLSCFGYFTTDATGGTVTLGLTWGGTGGTSLLTNNIVVTPTASVTAWFTVEARVTFTSPSACNALVTFTYNTGAATGYAGAPHMNGTESPVTVTVSSSELLSINATLSSSAHITAFQCLGAIAERVY
jgi:hypothetical protein